MDFLDFLDLQTNDKKSDRMRSWYLYEQYKSLEKHQLDAAEKLKNRSYQERLLHQELAERRARRRLYQRAPAAPPRADGSARARTDTHLSTTTTDDFYETFCELNDEFQTTDLLSDDEHTEPDAELQKTYIENFPYLDELRNEATCTESIHSVTDKTKTLTNKTLAEKLEAVQRNIAENINLQLETVKENMLCLEKYAMSDEEKTSEEELSVESVERSSPKTEALNKRASFLDKGMFTMWTRMVSFAYQVIQLNHGNCYYDYSSQLMTAVLACDILRRGINRMCRILQPFVSPIKLYTDTDSDESVVNSSYKNAKRKKSRAFKKITTSSQHMINPSVRKVFVTRRSGGGCYSENFWNRCSKYSMENVKTEGKYRSETWREPQRLSSGSSASCWPRELRRGRAPCRCCCHEKVLNPMLKLVRYLDDMLQSEVHDIVDR